MKVTICGPNLRDQSKGTFHVHAEGCADLKRGARAEPEYLNGWTVDVPDRLDVAAEVYADHICEALGDYEAPDEQIRAAAKRGYVQDFHFFPCCDGLPFERVPEEVTA